MREEIDGYRRTSHKSRNRRSLNQKIEALEERGEIVRVYESGGVHYIYVKKEKSLDQLREMIK